MGLTIYIACSLCSYYEIVRVRNILSGDPGRLGRKPSIVGPVIDLNIKYSGNMYLQDWLTVPRQILVSC